MSVDIEGRIRRANLVSHERHLERLYGDDVSHRLLRDVYSKKEGRMSEMTDRPKQSTVEDTPGDGKAFHPTPPQRRSPALVPAIITAVIAIGVIVALVARQPSRVAEAPVQVAEAFMAALNDHDADAVRSLLADDDVMTGEGVDGEEILVTIEQQLEQEEVFGWVYQIDACVERTQDANVVGVEIRCTYAFSNQLTRAIGTGPYSGNFYDVGIADGKIQSAENHENDGAFHSETLEVFFDWMQENYPGEVDDMYYEYADEANLAKWKLYLPEFVAAMDDAG